MQHSYAGRENSVNKIFHTETLIPGGIRVMYLQNAQRTQGFYFLGSARRTSLVPTPCGRDSSGARIRSNRKFHPQYEK